MCVEQIRRVAPYQKHEPVPGKKHRRKGHTVQLQVLKLRIIKREQRNVSIETRASLTVNATMDGDNEGKETHLNLTRGTRTGPPP
jgi:hypothetical protein